MLTTVRVKRFTVPAEAVREDLRDAVRNERVVRPTVIGLWSTAAFLLGVLIAIAR
jgi:demethoxyubiquinone hydroxylase (CLK1/Coq7/Cat5 family)